MPTRRALILAVLGTAAVPIAAFAQSPSPDDPVAILTAIYTRAILG